MEDQDKLRQMRSQDVLKQPNTSSFQDGMDQYQKPTDTKILDAINKLTYARDSDREFDDGTFVEALDTALACMHQMKPDLYPKAGIDPDADDWGNGYSRGYADGLQALRQMGSTKHSTDSTRATEPCEWCGTHKNMMVTGIRTDWRDDDVFLGKVSYCPNCGCDLKGGE